jgi:hypothetical protein
VEKESAVGELKEREKKGKAERKDRGRRVKRE